MKYKNIENIKNAQPFFYKGGNHGVLLIHGFTGSASHMGLIGKSLNEKGFTVKGINLLGHGTILTNMKGVTWPLWLTQVEEEYIALKEQCSYVSVGGLSMGGVLTLALAEKHPLTAMITYSAPMAVKNPMAKWAKAFSRVYPITKWRTPKERAFTLLPEYDLGYEGFPTESVGELLGLITHTKENLSKITSPLLVFQSHGDQTITKSSAEEIIKGVNSRKKEVVWFDDIPHVITISKAWEEIAGKSAAFLRSQEL